MKQLWSVFYFSLGIGIVLGLVIVQSLAIFDVNGIFRGFTIAINGLHLAAYSPYIEAGIIIGIIVAFIIAVHKVYSAFSYSSDQIWYLIPLGFFGGMLVILGRFGIISVVGLVLLAVGMAIAYSIEKEPYEGHKHEHVG